MSRTLVLVPTDLERRILEPRLAPARGDAGRIELCGFGPIAAAARTAGLLAGSAPDLVLLVGIAGRLDARLEIGLAYRFAEAACYGIGAGTAEDFQPAAALGWPQWPGEPGEPTSALGDVLPLAAQTGSVAAAGLLLTACAASATADDVALRRQIYPTALAEDMEGFGVALACRLAGIPLEIVRGISNIAGDRDKARWQIGPALAAAAELAAEILASRPEPHR